MLMVIGAGAHRWMDLEAKGGSVADAGSADGKLAFSAKFITGQGACPFPALKVLFLRHGCVQGSVSLCLPHSTDGRMT